MPFVTRYQVQDQQGRMWDGWDFTSDEDCAEEFTDEADAIEVSMKFGGEVFEYSRFDAIGDLPHHTEHFRHAAE